MKHLKLEKDKERRGFRMKLQVNDEEILINYTAQF
jgi:hypothetical protein